MEYSKTTILNDDEVKYLRDELLPSLEVTRLRRYYNLFYCDKIGIPQGIPEFKAISEKLLNGAGDSTGVYSHYFMRYKHPSFVRRHADNADEVSNTLITLLQECEEGGETIIYGVHRKDDYPWEDDSDVNRYNKGDDCIDDPIIPLVMKQSVGETLIYDRDVLHEVAQVQKGERIVLVSWFKNEQRKN